MANTFYVGTYANAKDKGIYLCQLNTTNGAMTLIEGFSGLDNPGFLALSPNRRFLYAACETYGGDGGSVAAFAIDERGNLTLLNQQLARGQGPCYIVSDRGGKNVVVASYGSGTVSCLPLLPDGKLAPASSAITHQGHSVNKDRQNEPHAHSINVDPGDQFAVAADLGTDKLYVYRLDTTRGTLTPNNPPATDATPGAGPRHFAFHPNGRFAYAINELNNTVTAYQWNGTKGTLKEIESVTTLPAGFPNWNSTAEVVVHPSGRYLYGSNRGMNTIVAYRIHGRTGRLTLIGFTPTQGKTPRNFSITPKGDFLVAANQDTNNLFSFAITQTTGVLKPTGQMLEISKPVCVRFV